jgi:hypothetical protein
MLLLLSACTLFTNDLRDQRWAELTGDSSTDGSAPSPDADGDGWSVAAGDCDDADAAIHPDAAEVCDHADNDCDDLTDEDPYPTERFPDNDGDGYGNGRTGSYACFPGDGWIENGDDCNDVNPDIHPGATEVCNGADEDCDGYLDEGLDFNSWYADADGDGYGTTPTINDCVVPGDGWTQTYGDCDDTRAGVNPGAAEECGNGLDDDCNGERECGWFDELEIEAEASARILGDTASLGLGGALAALGDVDGDGVDDLALAGDSGGASALYVFRGGLAGDRTPAAASLGVVGEGTLIDGIAYSHELEAYLVQDARFDGFRGAVYEIPLSSSGVLDPAELTPRWEGGEDTNDVLGLGLTISSNVTADGAETIVLPIPYRADVAEYGGEVQLLTTAGEELARVRGEDAYEYFGDKTLVLPDIDGDGLDDLAIGSWGPTGVPDWAYAVNLFVSPFSGTLARSDADAGFQGVEEEQLGVDAAYGSADLTGDGYNDFVVGSPHTYGEEGYVYIVPGPLSSSWTGHPKDISGHTRVQEQSVPEFGRTLATADFDADGNQDIAIGSPHHNYVGNDDGGVFVVYGPLDPGNISVNTTSVYVDDVEFQGVPSADFQVGYDLVTLNVNGDEFPDLAVGSVFADVGSLNSAGTTWILLGDGN